MSQITSLPCGFTRVSTVAFSVSAGLPSFSRRKLISGCACTRGSISLARAGHRVTLVEPSRRLVPTPYDYTQRRVEALEELLRRDKVTSHWSSQITGVEQGGVVVRHRTGRVERVEADTVLVTGRTPLRPALSAIPDHILAVHHIGDCRTVAGIGEALDDARAVANLIAG